MFDSPFPKINGIHQSLLGDAKQMFYHLHPNLVYPVLSEIFLHHLYACCLWLWVLWRYVARFFIWSLATLRYVICISSFVLWLTVVDVMIAFSFFELGILLNKCENIIFYVKFCYF